MSTRTPNSPNPSVPELSCNSQSHAGAPQPFFLESPLFHSLPPFCQTLPQISPLRATAPCPPMFSPKHLTSKVPSSSSIHPSHPPPHASPSPRALTPCSTTTPLLLPPALDTNFPATFLPATTSHYGHPSWLLLHDFSSLARISEKPDVGCIYPKFVWRRPWEQARKKIEAYGRSFNCVARSIHATTSTNRL